MRAAMESGFVPLLLLIAVAVGPLRALDQPIKECDQSCGLLKRILPADQYLNMLHINDQTLKNDAHAYLGLSIGDETRADEPNNLVVVGLRNELNVTDIEYYYFEYYKGKPVDA